MIRSFFAVFGGILFWGLAWISTNSVLLAVMPDRFTMDAETNQPIGTDGLIQVLLIVLSVLLSVVAGLFTASTAKRREMLHVGILTGIQFALGVFFQTTNWHVFPVVYHVVFLGLQLPSYFLGAKLLLARRAA